MEEQTLVAIIGCSAVIVLMLIRVPIAVSMGLVGVLGFAYMVSWGPAIRLLVDSPFRTVTNFNFSVIPMFVLMGTLVSVTGMSRELFRAAAAWLGHLPGGMAIATIFACGGFAAINGSSVATAATMTQVALPEMRRAGYSPGISAGVIATAGTLGIMIPPSVMFILYAILTDTDVIKLFMAGVMPGILGIALYSAGVLIVYWFKPEWMPRAKPADWTERMASLKDVWAVLLLFAVVVGGMYGGFVTATEAAGLGVLGAFVIGVARRRLSWSMMVEAMVDSLRTSAAIFFIIIGAFLFQYFLAVTQTSQQLAEWVGNLPLPPIGIIVAIMAFYIVTGMFVDELAIMLLTVPILYPVIIKLGFDPVWFGVLVVTTVEIGLYAPPIGMICFVMNKMVPDIGLINIYKGALPFLVSDLCRLGLIIAFPQIALWFANSMS